MSIPEFQKSRFKTEAWHSLSSQEVLKILKAKKEGLSEEEAKTRLKKFGPNSLPEEKKLNRLTIFLSQFKSPLIYILIGAAAISFLLQEFIDMGVITAAIFINTIVGFIQEDKANRAITKLKKMVEYKTRVIRDNLEKEIHTSLLVPGDILLLEAGDKVPADARLIETFSFQVSEAPLTGESLPSTKSTEALETGRVLADRENMVYMGTTVERGRGKTVVVSTGPKTQIGKIALLVKEVKEEETPLQRQLSRFAKILGLVILLISLAILFLGLLRGRPFFEMFLTVVAIAVAAIPEGLLVAVTVILAIGMQKILKQKSLMRRLVATETLGTTSVICTDKTGTLTEGIMQVAYILTGSKELVHDGRKLTKTFEVKQEEGHLLALKIALLCNNAAIENPHEELKDWIILGDPTERALLLAAVQSGLNKVSLEKSMPRLKELPFDPEKKFMATWHKLNENHQMLYLKGAPEEILAKSHFLYLDGKIIKLNQSKKAELTKKNDELTKKGLRVLAVAYKKMRGNLGRRDQGESNFQEDCYDLVFVGLIGLKDPLRPEARETIQLTRQAGIRPIIVTGDHRLTAQTIALEVGLPVKEKNIVEGARLDKMSDDQLKKIVKTVDIYARVEPKHKLRIVDAWQAQGEVVAMTGDGINDAPALKSADIGVALGSGTDVAKETSDMILLDNNFKTIVSAIEQGRVIFDNIRKVILYLLSDSFSEIFLITGAILLGWPLPLLAAQILWINLLTDGFPNIALTMEPEEKEVMREPPRKKNQPVLNFEMKFLIGLISFITGIGNLILFYLIWKTTGDIEKARTIVFVALGIDSLLYVFSCRSLRHSIWHKNLFSNKYLILAVIAGFILQLVAIYWSYLQEILRTVPLNFTDWGIILVVSFTVIAVIEVAKYIFIVQRRTT